MIVCASLVVIESGKVLLVRVRDNAIWYFPGGKIDAGETAEQALARELAEELHISVSPTDLVFLTDVIAANHDHTDQVHLFVYRIAKLPTIAPRAEISEVKWFDLTDTALMAPAVIEVLEKIKSF